MTLVISGVSNLVLTGPEVGPGEPPQASIWCNYTVQFRISNSHNVSLRALDIYGCGVPNSHPVGIDMASAVLFDYVHSLVVENLWIRQSHGYGLLTYNCFTYMLIRNCHFNGNYRRALSMQTGGNTLIYYNTTTRGHTIIEVINSSYLHGQCQHCPSGLGALGSGGLNIFFVVAVSNKVHHVFLVSIINCSLVNNTGYYGGNMCVRHKSSDLVEVNLSIQHSSFINGTAKRGGGGLSIRTRRRGSFDIINSTFTCNTCNFAAGVYNNSDGGGVHVEMYISNIVRIVASQFSNNVAVKGGGFYITIIRNLDIRSNSSMSAEIKDSVFDSNTAIREGGHGYLVLEMYTGICNAVITLSGCLFEKGHAERGGAISMELQRSRHCGDFSYFVKIKNNKLMENFALQGAGIFFYFWLNLPTEYSPQIHLSGTHIVNNKAKVSIIHIINGITPGNILTTSKTIFYNNTVTPLQFNSAVLYLDKVYKSLISDTTFDNNIGHCIRLVSSSITLQGHVQFYNNIAYAGAALLLDCHLDSLRPSFLVIHPYTTVTIANNTALYYGGGLAVNPACNYNNLCFFQISSLVNTVVDFYDNKALVSANSIVGPPVTQCDSQSGQMEGIAAFTALFRVEGGYSSDQVVLSAVNSICFCDEDEFSCKTVLDVNIWPGEEFIVLAMITGKLYDTSSSYIRASLTNIEGTSSRLGNSKLQEIQELKRSCKVLTYSKRSCDVLTYSVVTSAERAQIKLQIDSTPSAPPSFVNIVIQKCPLGFQIGIHRESCVCSKYLTSQIQEITCDILTTEIAVPGKVWVGNYSGILAVHRHCPLDYCSPEPHSVDLQRQHLQCTSNRSGVLCGGYQTGLSLGLGTARCLDNCSNYYLLLVFPFTLAGLVLVLILLKCNFTVSVGTINGLIFYANIVHVNRTVFFPQNKHLFFTKMFVVFVAWLNLDLGVEACFCRGMTTYVNTWLQFAFPIYIWVLVLIMIYTSRYSVTISKIIGRNAVSVLATLFLLSYTKLLRTVIAAVSSTSLGDEDGRSHLLWLMDGNVIYFSAPHAVLFFTALLAVLLYILPFTLLTLLAPCLQARTNHRMMRWVVRIKPLLDAYQGPYKDKYRHWTGVMLLLRLILFVVHSANTLGNPNINVFAVSMSVITIHLYQIYVGKLYKNWINWFLEGFYSCNLLVFSMTVLFLNGSQGSSEALACVMVGSAFLVFCLIVVWHFNHQTRAISRAGERLKQLWTSQRRRQAEDTQELPDSPPRQPQPTISVIDMKELREPLLTDN